MRNLLAKPVCLGLLALMLVACSDGSDGSRPIPAAPDENTVFAVANQCFAISPDARKSFIASTSCEEGYHLDATAAQDGSRFLMRPSDLGK